ncbi:MAG: glycosyltransferase [Magnetococcus sp. THC-1_WYH]
MKVSVALIIYNEEKHIKDCLDALLAQSFHDFEIIIINNGSTDKTSQILESYTDERIKVFLENSRCGLASLRNISIQKASGEYIFFTDGDCIPSHHWIEEGLKILESRQYIGVEGKTFYTSEFGASNFPVESFAGEFMTCNIAYPRHILKKINYFDTELKRAYEDRDLAMRLLAHGRIFFHKEMIVVHQKKRISIKSLFNHMKRIENRVYLIKKHGKTSQNIRFNIVYPKKLFAIFCPLAILFIFKYNSLYDCVFGFFYYFALCYERLLLWKFAFKSKIFLV